MPSWRSSPWWARTWRRCTRTASRSRSASTTSGCPSPLPSPSRKWRKARSSSAARTRSSPWLPPGRDQVERSLATRAMSPSFPRNVLLGVTGSIAAYKSALLVRELVKAGAKVQVVMTPAAHDFVTPLTLATLSKRPGAHRPDEQDGGWHLEQPRRPGPLGGRDVDRTRCRPTRWARWPTASATTCCWPATSAPTCPIFVAPAMDLEMFRMRASSADLDLLKERGVRVNRPRERRTGQRPEGEGRMTEPEAIVAALQAASAGEVEAGGQAGPHHRRPHAGGDRPGALHRQPISTGKMGFALAEEAALRGATVELVTGPVTLTRPSARASARRRDDARRR